MLNTEGKLKVKYNFTEGHMRPRVLKLATLTSFPWSLVVAPCTVNLQTLTLVGLYSHAKRRIARGSNYTPPPPHFIYNVENM